MCLAAFALDAHPRFPWVLAANRDEFFDRPTAPLAWWSAQPGEPVILSGRDLRAGGTWMGLTPSGRFALLTNVRNGQLPPKPNAPSRGELVTQWLRSQVDAQQFHEQSQQAAYNGYNLLVADWQTPACHWLHPAAGQPQAVPAGVHAVSNGSFNEPWPKLTGLVASLNEALTEAGEMDAQALSNRLFQALLDPQQAPLQRLPKTGIPVELEQQLSAIFIRPTAHGYGTRCSTVIVTERTPQGLRTLVSERTHGQDGQAGHFTQVVLPGWPAQQT